MPRSKNCKFAFKIPAKPQARKRKDGLSVDHLPLPSLRHKRRGKVCGSSGSWFGVTYPEDKPVVVASVKKLVDAGEYPAPLWG